MGKNDTNGGPNHLLDSLHTVLASIPPSDSAKGGGRAARGKRGSKKLPLTISRPELLVDGSDRLYRQLVHNLLSFLAIHEAIRDGIASCIGLGGIQHTILLSIRHLGQGKEVSVRDVADHLELSGSFITAETAKLERAGLLDKKRSATDGRKVSLELTDKAMELFDSVAPLQRAIGDVQFGSLTRKQFRELVPVVSELVRTSREALLLLHYLKSNDAGLRRRGSGITDPDEIES